MTETVETRQPREPSGGPAPRAGGPALPEIPGPVETAVFLWRRLRRMSTALGLLFALAAASVVATFIPQEPLIRSTVEDWRAGDAGPGAGVARAFDALGLFDVFGSWWFAVLTVLLFVSLTGCLLPRWGAFLRVVRRHPVRGHALEGLSNRRSIETALDPDTALRTAGAVLRRRRYRVRLVPGAEAVAGSGAQVAAERGHAREGGSLLFHSAFYLVLAGAVIGHSFGFNGQINIVEGSAFADTRLAYNLAEPGRWFGVEDHRGFVVRLDDFSVGYHDGFVPAEFVSTVTIEDEGRAVREGTVRVNHPFPYDGMRLYQMRFGMAPRIVVRAGDEVLFDEAVMLSDAGGFVWTGAAKISAADPQIALDLVFLPDAAVNDRGIPFSRSPEPRNPRLLVELYVGEDLGLQRPLPVSQFEREESARIDPPAVVEEGGSAPMAAGNLTLEFPELRMWSGFQVSHAPGRWLLLGGGALLLAGLLPSLYSYRRRVWAQASPLPGGGSRLVLAGVALQRKPAFAEEFVALADRVDAALGGPNRSRPSRSGEDPEP